ncbi:MAG: GatB/YqeY domain-containing protein [Oscillospiraceae bacterium]|nr:GatB/YqeY domain-containing protein [Oscillospiraceae bacterium]
MEFKTLQKEMIAAMKAKDKDRKEAISGLIAAVKKIAIDEGVREDIPDEMVDKTILKELKSAKEQVDTCPDSRPELKAEYEKKAAVISEFAPVQMSEQEIRAVIEEKFSDVVKSGNKGLIMKTIMGELGSKADGKIISRIVSEICAK